MNILNSLKRKEIRLIEAELERIDHLVADISEAHLDGDYMGAAHDTLELIINECRRRQLEMECEAE